MSSRIAKKRTRRRQIDAENVAGAIRRGLKRRKARLTNEKVKAPALKTGIDVTTQRVQLYLRSRFNPILRLTPELLSLWLDKSKVGFLREIALAWDSIAERDDKIKLASGLREKSVARFDYQIEFIDGLEDKDKAQAEKHKEALEFFFANLTVTRAIDENERGGVKMLVRQMMNAVGAKYSVHEIVWKPQADGNMSAELRWTPLWFFENRTGRLRYLEMDGDLDGQDLEEAGWMVTTGEGLMYACAIAYMYKTLPLRDWLTFSQRNGMPGFLGKTGAAVGTEQWEAMMDAVEALAAGEFAAVMNESESVEVLDLKGSQAELPYEPLIERMDRAIVALWRGGDLSTMSSGKHTQGHGSQRQDEEADALLLDDVELIDETIHQWLTKYVIEFQFGDDRSLARYKTVVPPEQATAQDIAIDQFLVGVAPKGEGLSWKDTLKRYGRVAAAPGDPVLIAPVQDEQIPPNLANARLTNIRTAVQNKAINAMLASAHTMLTKAQAQVLAPLHKRVQAALNAPDAQLANEINRVVTELPEMLKQMNLQPATARILENAYTTALLDGLTIPIPTAKP